MAFGGMSRPRARGSLGAHPLLEYGMRKILIGKFLLDGEESLSKQKKRGLREARAPLRGPLRRDEIKVEDVPQEHQAWAADYDERHDESLIQWSYLQGVLEEEILALAITNIPKEDKLDAVLGDTFARFDEWLTVPGGGLVAMVFEALTDLGLQALRGVVHHEAQRVFDKLRAEGRG